LRDGCVGTYQRQGKTGQNESLLDVMLRTVIDLVLQFLLQHVDQRGGEDALRRPEPEREKTVLVKGKTVIRYKRQQHRQMLARCWQRQQMLARRRSRPRRCSREPPLDTVAEETAEAVSSAVLAASTPPAL